MNPILTRFREILPAYISRKQVAEHFQGLISAKYLANLDCQQKGPKAYRFGGRKVVYNRDDFLEWLDGRLIAL